ncbi:glycoside hydrolase family 65 protein [Paraburkholderia sabiae]|nr:putative glycosyl hydrolase [Paraburkholderia sabiae]
MPAEYAEYICFQDYSPQDELRRESLLGLGNGILFVRASAPEQRLTRESLAGAPETSPRYPGLYRAGLYDTVTGEVAGHSVRCTALPRLPDATILAARRPGSAWLGTDTAELLAYRHELDMLRATAVRSMTLRMDGASTRIEERRFVSAAHPYLAVIRWRITACDWSGPLEIADGIDSDVRNALVERQKAFTGRHLAGIAHRRESDGVLLVSATLAGQPIEIAVATRLHVCGSPENSMHAKWKKREACIQSRIIPLRQGEPVCIDKVVAVHTSRDTTAPNPIKGVLACVRGTAEPDTLELAHHRAWLPAWRQVRVDCADPETCRALNVRAFHVLQTVNTQSALEDMGVPARGWQEGYYGHVFWDDLFVLPEVGRNEHAHRRGALLYRYRRLDAARRAAQSAGFAGAMYPWRSAATGDEETPLYQFNPLDAHWMRDDTRLQRHVGASVAWNVWRYVEVSGDMEFLRQRGAEMIVEIARFWASIARLDESTGRYVIEGVIGPDEYHNAYPDAAYPGLDNNAYTNVMAMWTLPRAEKTLTRLDASARDALSIRIGLTADEPGEWANIARKMTVSFRDDGIIEQFDGFSGLRYARDPRSVVQGNARVDWALESQGDSVDRWQIVKQPDVIMLFYLLGETRLRLLLEQAGYRFDEAAARRTLDHYLVRLTHESSLSKVACAGALARHDSNLSLRYFMDALGTDMTPCSGSAHEGLHLGALAGGLDVIVRRYAGIEVEHGHLVVEPAWPPALPAIALSLQFRQQRLRIAADAAHVAITADIVNSRAASVFAEGTMHKLGPGETMAVRNRCPEG